jgi:hypothetical protein
VTASSKSLEQKISKAQAANGSQSSGDVAALLTELEAAIAAATENAKLEHERSLDPSVTPDAKKARQDAEDAQFRRGSSKLCCRACASVIRSS